MAQQTISEAVAEKSTNEQTGLSAWAEATSETSLPKRTRAPGVDPQEADRYGIMPLEDDQADEDTGFDIEEFRSELQDI
jgi:hypothetical protein